MSEQDTEQVSREPGSEPATPLRPETGGRADDRNEEVPESPVPDPTAKDTNAGDDPQAD